MKHMLKSAPVSHTETAMYYGGLTKGVFKGGGSGGSNPPPEIFQIFFEK